MSAEDELRSIRRLLKWLLFSVLALGGMATLSLCQLVGIGEGK